MKTEPLAAESVRQTSSIQKQHQWRELWWHCTCLLSWKSARNTIYTRKYPQRLLAAKWHMQVLGSPDSQVLRTDCSQWLHIPHIHENLVSLTRPYLSRLCDSSNVKVGLARATTQFYSGMGTQIQANCAYIFLSLNPSSFRVVSNNLASHARYTA